MSLPKFSSLPADLEDSVYQILASVAMEEIGMSHIINAEGEKLQYVLGTLEGSLGLEDRATTQEIHEINDSIQTVLSNISINQLHMYNKLNTALNAYRKKKQYSGGRIELELIYGQENVQHFGNKLYVVPDSNIQLSGTGTMPDGTPANVIWSLSSNAPAGAEIVPGPDNTFELIIPADAQIASEFLLRGELEGAPNTRKSWQVHVNAWGNMDLNGANMSTTGIINILPNSQATLQYAVTRPEEDTGDITFSLLAGNDIPDDIFVEQDDLNNEITIITGEDAAGEFTLIAEIDGWNVINEWTGEVIG